MEYADKGSLKDVLHEMSRGMVPTLWNPTDIGIIICGFVLGMRFIHSQGIIHCDLKPSNLLLGSDGRVLVADFGASQSVSRDRAPVATTPHYAAPELSEEAGICSGKSDVFTFGLIVYEILARKPVFDSEHEPLASVIRRLRARDLPTVSPEWGELMVELIPTCWQADRAERPSFEEIFRLFRAQNFKILPGADTGAIRHYCQSILTWEEQNRGTH
jgi:serine/threonine protein kinase